MKKYVQLFATLLLVVILGQGCPGNPGDPTGPEAGEGSCAGLVIPPIPVDIGDIPCDVLRITGRVTWDGGSLEATVDRNNPSVTIDLESGPDRQVYVDVYTSDSPDSPSRTLGPFTVCIPDGEPLTVNCSWQVRNRPPRVSITPSEGTAAPDQPLRLTARASDPDGCDRVTGYEWSTDCGTVAASGSTALWTPARGCQGARAASSATVTVEARDGRGGRSAATANFTVQDNTPPRITSFTKSPVYISPDNWNLLTVTAVDDDGDAMTPVWSPPPVGTFVDLGPSGSGTWRARWYEPSYSGTPYTVTVRVRDSFGDLSDPAQISVQTGP